jgi:hypothetical protein
MNPAPKSSEMLASPTEGSDEGHMGRQLAPVRRAQELLLADRTMKSVIAELETCFGVSSTDAIAAIVVGRALNRAAATADTRSPVRV